MKANGLIWVLSACVLLSACLVWGQATASAPAAPLAPRHTDLRNGFSLCPPAGTEQLRVTSGSQIVTWVSRDASSGAINWTLGVEKLLTSARPIDVKAMGPKIVQSMIQSQGLKTDFTRDGTIGQRATYEFAGQATVGKGLFWRRQLWVQQTEGVALVVGISGSLADKEKLDTVFTAVIGTLEVSDPRKYEQAVTAGLEAGKAVIAGLTEQKIKGAIRAEPQYFLLKLKGKTIGYMVQREAGITDPWPGVSVSVQTVIDLQGHRVLTREMSASLDRKKEAWKETLVVDSQAPGVEEGSLQDGEISSSVKFADEKPASHKAKAPPEYLPRALGMLLPRLLPLDKAGRYSVLSYDSTKNMFETRTLTTEQKSKINIGGSEVDCYQATDQMGLEAQPASLCLDASGNVLQMQTAEGLTMETATQAQVQKAFPNMK